MLKDIILENEKKINVFDEFQYMQNKEYPTASALEALKITNDIQMCYFEQEDQDCAFNVLKLYALLQSLFVSVDSLYALSYSLTKSKSFININKNPSLRELKYIRNDVVGHPATRVLNLDTLAYCILDEKQTHKFDFVYTIYFGDGKEEKKVDLLKVVQSYYEESNYFLDQLYAIAKRNLNQDGLILYCRKAVDAFETKGNYIQKLKEFEKKYREIYPQASSNQHRALWRLEIIDFLLKYEPKDSDILALKEYCIGLEIIKIYQLLSDLDCHVELQKRNPYLVSSFYRFLNKNPDLIPLTQYIYDGQNPLFVSSYKKIMDFASEKQNKGVIKYLTLLKELYDREEDELLYAFALPLKGYKQK